MISPDKDAALRALLGRVAGPLAVRLAEAVEADRLAGGTSLPHAAILESLTPALRRNDGMMEAFAERAAHEIWAALPVQSAGAFAGGPAVPDLTRAPGMEASARALVRARMIDCDGETAATLRSYSDHLVRESRTAFGEKRDNAKRCLALAADLTGILLGADEAENLRRRARTAMSVSAAA
jgi:hypothetical protein